MAYYNANVKQKQELCGKTLSPKVRTKCLYTNPIVANVAGKIKRILCIDSGSDSVSQHHDCSTSFVQRDV